MRTYLCSLRDYFLSFQWQKSSTFKCCFFHIEDRKMIQKIKERGMIMRFYSWKEMYDCLREGVHLYNPNVEKYVTCDAAGTLCVYNVDRAESMSLAEKARRAKKEWSDFLEKGKALADSHFDGNNEILLYLEPSYEFCRNNYTQEGWVNTKIIK